jgi:hypothetical protein
MHLVLAVSLVLLNAASAANSLSMTEGEVRGLVQWNNIDFFRNAGFSDATFSRRRLQAKCSADSSVNFADDDYYNATFDAQYDPMCTCDEESNEDAVTSARTALGEAISQNATTQEVQSLLDAYNEAVDNFTSKFDYQCMTGCEACFDDLCGIVETRYESSEYGMSPTNATAEQIVGDTYQFPYTQTLYSSDCITYTKNESGKLCVYSNVSYYSSDGVPASFPCVLEYNGVMCKSCEYQLMVRCGIGDCTNINPDANVNTCNGTGDVGPFKFLKYAARSVSSNGTISLGSCNASIPPAPTPTAEPPTNGAAPPTAPTPASTSGAATTMTGLRATLLALLVTAACLV